MNKAQIDQLLDQFITEAVHIHRLARGEMFNGFFALRSTNQTAITTRHCFTGNRLYRRTTHRALLGKNNVTRIRWTFIFHDGNYLWNHIASAPHNNGVTNFNTQALDFIAIMQGGIRHGYAANKYRLQTRDRGYRAGASHLKLDVLQ